VVQWLGQIGGFMATSSFSRNFVVTDPDMIEKLRYDLEHPIKVKFAKRDLAKESREGIESLKLLLAKTKAPS
jgi:hypothetical protein